MLKIISLLFTKNRQFFFRHECIRYESKKQFYFMHLCAVFICVLCATLPSHFFFTATCHKQLHKFYFFVRRMICIYRLQVILLGIFSLTWHSKLNSQTNRVNITFTLMVIRVHRGVVQFILKNDVIQKVEEGTNVCHYEP